MVSERIVKLLREYNRIGVAVSGGMDSMVLLHYLYYRDYDLIVINIEHGIRGEQSLRDSAFVSEYCRELSIPCKVIHVESREFAERNGYTLEQAARILRHNEFKKFHDKHGIPIATAHHKSDQAESIFMHIARGSGIDGLNGMNAADGYLIRPFIDTNKRDIIDYAAAHEVPHTEDETNSDIAYDRNFVRHKVFPLISERYPGITESLAKIGRRAEEIRELIDAHTPLITDSYGAKLFRVNGLNRALAANAIMKSADALGCCSDIEERHIDALIALPNNRSCDLPHGLIAYKEGDMLALERKKAPRSVEFPFSEGEYGFGYGVLEVKIGDKALKGYKQLDIDKCSGAVIRTRRNGDKIRLSYGSKNVSDVLNEAHIPIRLKERVPIISAGDRVIAVADLQAADEARVKGACDRMINIRWIKE